MVLRAKTRAEAIPGGRSPVDNMHFLHDRLRTISPHLPGPVQHGNAKPVGLTVHDPLKLDDALIAAWDRLAAVAVEPNPFAESWAVLPGLDAFDKAQTARLFALWHGQRELAGLILLVDQHHYGRFAIQHAANWSHPNSFLGTPLVRAGWEEIFWRNLLETLDADPKGQALLYLTGMVEGGPVHRGLRAATVKHRRPCDTVFRECRAMIEPNLPTQEYWNSVVRGKKRKELRRQSARLAELGALSFDRLGADGADAPVEEWVDDFLSLERAGWKGEAGSALGSSDATSSYFRAVVRAAHRRGQLDALAFRLNDKPIAMLFHFISGKGGFSFKTTYDERYARYSPGVLIQRENLDLLAQRGLDWIDSCAAPDHPMINSLWAERRTIIRVAIPIGGVKGRLVFSGVRMVERLRAWTKGAQG